MPELMKTEYSTNCVVSPGHKIVHLKVYLTSHGAIFFMCRKRAEFSCAKCRANALWVCLLPDSIMLIVCVCMCAALMPHLEAVNFNLDRFIAVLHSVGGGAFIFLYILMVDG